MSKRPGVDRETFENLLAGVGAQGTAALFMLTFLLRAMKRRGVLSDLDLRAVAELAIEKAASLPVGYSEKYRQSVVAELRQLQDLALAIDGPPRAH